MSIFESIAAGYKRWRHRRGYGVHSPFAYHLVKMAIAPEAGYAHYGYRDIDFAIPADTHPGLRHDLRLLLRLCATLRSESITVPEFVHPDIRKGAATVARSLHIPFHEGHREGRKGDFLFLPGNTPAHVDALKWLHSGGAIMAAVPEDQLKADLLGYRECGVTFKGRKTILVVPNADVAFVAYDMKF